jgi:quinoprotein glucose dehydrogenase
MLTTRTPEAHAWAVQQFHTFLNGGQFYPFALNKQTVVFPGFEGGGEWGGPAIDPKTDTLFIDANEMAWTAGVVEAGHNLGRGAQTYQQQCAVCHGRDRAGSPPDFPSLIDLGKRMTAEQVANKIRQGGGRMPAMTGMQNADVQAVVRYLESGAPGGADAGGRPAPADKYVSTGSREFLDPDGYPAIQPPWGTLSAIDLKTGKYLWKISLGEYPALVKQGMRNTGSEMYGGPIVTASGVLFIGATVHDRKFRAFDSRTGKLLWETELPFAALATPSTYMVNGRQYVVIAASGGRDRKEPVGGSYVAFALPR